MRTFTLLFAMLLMTLGGTAMGQTAAVQVIHDSADPAASTVDVGAFTTAGAAIDLTPGSPGDRVTGVNYRTATPYISIPTGVDFDLKFFEPGTDNVADSTRVSAGTITAGNEYRIIATGFLAAGGNTAFEPDIEDGLSATTPGDVELSFYHGSTDFGPVDVYLAITGDSYPANPQFAGISYKTATSYTSIIPVEVKARIEQSGTEVDEQTFNLTDYSGEAITIIASGERAENDFGLYIVPAGGGAFVPISDVTSVDEVTEAESLAFYPNPAADEATLAYELTEQVSQASVSISDMSGRQLQHQQLGSQVPGMRKARLNLAELEAGMYLYELTLDGESQAGKFMVK